MAPIHLKEKAFLRMIECTLEQSKKEVPNSYLW